MTATIYKIQKVSDEGFLPISLSDAYTHLYLIESEVDAETAAYVESLIHTAKEKVEYDAGKIIVKGVYRGYLNAFPSGNIIIPLSPIISIDKVEYLSSGSYSEWSTAEWESDVIAHPAYIRPKDGYSYPDEDTAFNAVKITFTAGHETVGEIASLAIHAMKLLIGHWWENRQEVVTGTQVNMVPMNYNEIINILANTRFG